MKVTRSGAERLRAMGWRAEETLLDGKRIVKDYPHGVYGTITPLPPDTPEGALYFAALWSSDSGALLWSHTIEHAEVAASKLDTEADAWT